MKKIFIVLILASGISICAIAQKKAPKEVVKTFTEKFANASSIKWNRESADEWEAEFKLNGKEMSAAFNIAGKWLETETEISAGELPSAVSETLSREYAGCKMTEVSIVENPELKGYEIVLKKGESAVEVVADRTGKILKRETLNTESDEDKD